MHLEERAARRAVDKLGVVVVEVLQSLLQVGRGGRLVERDVEERDVGVERELVHRVDPRQVRKEEVEDGRAVGGGAIAFAGGVDLLLGLLRDDELLRHLGRGRLGRLEREDKLVVVEQRAGCRREHVKDGILQLDELPLPRRHGDHEVILLRLELWPLLADHRAEELSSSPCCLTQKLQMVALVEISGV